MKNDIFWCKNCWMPSTRPNITFDNDGVCHACRWAEEKKRIDWEERQKYLGELCDKFRGNGREPDMIVPWSGGKDSVYVAYQMKDKFGMNPLLLSVIPPLETDIGKHNRVQTKGNFWYGEIQLPPETREMSKQHFVRNGKIKHPWECAISSLVIKAAIEKGLPFIMYGEEGGMEYGGTNSEHNSWKDPVSLEYLMKNYYLNSLDWEVPDTSQVFFTQYSRFEDWDPVVHAEFAKKKGMQVLSHRSVGTYTNDCQLSDKLQDLHQYVVFIKFGFGRCSADASIAIRSGTLDRNEALELIEIYDGEFPNEYLEEYCDYLRMSTEEFSKVLCSHANKSIMAGVDHIWTLKNIYALKRRQGTDVALASPNRFNPDKNAT